MCVSVWPIDGCHSWTFGIFRNWSVRQCWSAFHAFRSPAGMHRQMLSKSLSFLSRRKDISIADIVLKVHTIHVQLVDNITLLRSRYSRGQKEVGEPFPPPVPRSSPPRVCWQASSSLFSWFEKELFMFSDCSQILEQEPITLLAVLV